MDQEEDYPIPIPSAPKKLTLQNDEIMELLWQNGVVLQSQNQRLLRKTQPSLPARNTAIILEPPAAAREVRVRSSEEEEHYGNQHLFMQEDEIASWLQYSIDEDPPPLDQHDFCDETLYPPPPNQGGSTADIGPVSVQRPTIPPARRIQNFLHFSKQNNARAEIAPPASSKAATALREPTVVDSCDTPAATAAATVAAAAVSMSSAERGDTGCQSLGTAEREPSLYGGRETSTCEMTLSSSPGGSSGSTEPVQRNRHWIGRGRAGNQRHQSFKAR
ncbi:hypothetical protein PIB30_071604 [Stylosanthes scabra]|uniref:Uncharacterized protein n=1 Tax=Stylosanthes scabra TaxID=79078 RepID=A0ABU6TNJ8_9FABA|nr:hypothetical protein [Stylosanthes scabra]